MAVLAQAIMRGLLAARPAATVNTAGRLYAATDTGVVYRVANDGSGWEEFVAGGSGAVTGYYEPMTNGDPVTPEILFDADGDVIVAWVTL
jgi:hypothetical protein